MSATSPQTAPQRGQLVSAGLRYRLPALAIDVLAGFPLVAFGYWVGVFDTRIFRVPAGWFWSEWLLKFWLDERRVIVLPLLGWVLLSVVISSVSEALAARSFGGRIIGLVVIEKSGIKIGPLLAFWRAWGALLNALALGLGYLWILVSSNRRGWHDAVSATYVVRDSVGEAPADTL